MLYYGGDFYIVRIQRFKFSSHGKLFDAVLLCDSRVMSDEYIIALKEQREISVVEILTDLR